MEFNTFTSGLLLSVLPIALLSGCGGDKTGQTSVNHSASSHSYSSSIQNSSAIAQFEIEVTAGEGGSISPSPRQYVTTTDSTTFTITAVPGYKIESVTGCNGMGGQVMDAGGERVVKTLSYNVASITASCVVHANFKPSLATQVPDIDEEFARCVDYSADGLTQIGQVTRLNCGGYRLMSLKGIEAFTALQDFSLSYSQVSGDIDFSPFPQLKKLSLIKNSIDGVDISQNSNLEEFTFTTSSSVDLSAFALGLTNKPQLKSLSLGADVLVPIVHPTVSLDLGALTKLETLNLSRTNLMHISFSSLNAALKTLSLSDAALNDLDVSNLASLEKLDISSNNIAVLDLSNNVNLKSLFAGKNVLTDLGVSGLSGLTYVDASENELATVTGIGSVLDKKAILIFSMNPLNTNTLNDFYDLKNVQGYENLNY